MTQISRPHIVIHAPTDEIPIGRGFYQLEEDSLYVQAAPFDADHRYFSFLESKSVRMDFDRLGRLLFLEVSTPRRHWQATDFLPPGAVNEADMRWLDYRRRMLEPRLLTDEQRRVLCLEFGAQAEPMGVYRIATNVLVEVTDSSLVSRLWVTEMTDDLAGQEIAAFRRQRRDNHHQVD